MINLHAAWDYIKYTQNVKNISGSKKFISPDAWFHEFIESGRHPECWGQGAVGAAKSYLARIDKEHLVVAGAGG